MMLYAFLDKLMTDGLPWKPKDEQVPKLPRDEMRRTKVEFRRRQKRKQSEIGLIKLLPRLGGWTFLGTPRLLRAEHASLSMYCCSMLQYGGAPGRKIYS